MAKYHITIVDTVYNYTTYAVESDKTEKQIEEDIYFGDYDILEDADEIGADGKEGDSQLHSIEEVL